MQSSYMVLKFKLLYTWDICFSHARLYKGASTNDRKKPNMLLKLNYECTSKNLLHAPINKELSKLNKFKPFSTSPFNFKKNETKNIKEK